MIRDEVLMITTPEEAERQMATELYPVADLVMVQDRSGEKWADYDSLIQMLVTTIQPETWEDVGGPGSMAPLSYQGTEVLSIRQTDEAHEEITKLLARMRGLAEPRDEDDLPVRERREMDYGGYGGMQGIGYGGMGGMGGGGMGMGGGGFRASASERTDLLQGLQDTNRELQGEQMKKLDKMYKEGSGMGGMGGGFFQGGKK